MYLPSYFITSLLHQTTTTTTFPTFLLPECLLEIRQDKIVAAILLILGKEDSVLVHTCYISFLPVLNLDENNLFAMLHIMHFDVFIK